MERKASIVYLRLLPIVFYQKHSVNSTLDSHYYDVYISKLDSSGDFVWAKQLGGVDPEEGKFIYVDEFENIYTTGYFSGTPDFDPGSGSYSMTMVSPNVDVFVHKMTQCGNSINVGTNTHGTTIASNQLGASYQWINCSNNSLIVGETGSSFTATENGNYAVIVSIGSCTDTSDCINITSVGVEDNTFGNQLSVYPNPSNGHFNVEVQNSAQIIITDQLGRVIYNSSVQSGKNAVDLTDSDCGVYFLQLIYENGQTVNTHFIIEK